MIRELLTIFSENRNSLKSITKKRSNKQSDEEGFLGDLEGAVLWMGLVQEAEPQAAPQDSG